MVAVAAVEVVSQYGLCVRWVAKYGYGPGWNNSIEDRLVRRESRIARCVAVAYDGVVAGLDGDFSIPELVAVSPGAKEKAVHLGLTPHIEGESACLIVR